MSLAISLAISLAAPTIPTQDSYYTPQLHQPAQ